MSWECPCSAVNVSDPNERERGLTGFAPEVCWSCGAERAAVPVKPIRPVYVPPRESTRESTREHMHRHDPVSWQQCKDAGRFG